MSFGLRAVNSSPASLQPRLAQLSNQLRGTKPHLQHLPIRRASSSMASTNEWLVIVPDLPNKLEERMKVRAQHFEGLNASPQLKFGGGLLASQPKEGEKLQLYGSALTVQAETREDVIEILKKDIYATSGVWNVDIAQILPFKTGVRESLPPTQ